MTIVSYWNAAVFTLLLVCLLLACSVRSDTATPITRTAAYPRVIERAKKNNRHFIMYSAKDTFVVTSVLVERSKQQFTVHLNRLDSLHRINLNNPKAFPEKHIHVYVRDSASYTLDEPHTIPLNKVERIVLVD